MLAMIARRLLILVPMLLIVSFLVFGMTVLIPGDAAVTIAGGPDAPPGAIKEVRRELELDEPFLERYVDWLGGVVHGDFGNSLYTHRPVADEIWDRAPVTFGLTFAVLALSIPIALLVGIAGGLRPGSFFDRLLLFFSSVAVAMPGFWIAIVLVTIFAVQLHWLPPFGYVPFSEEPWEWARHIIMPAIALAVAGAAVLSRQVRGGLADTMQSSFIRTAWAKGGSTRRVVVGHALKNSAIPAVTVLGLQVGAIIGGTVLIEQIFALPGLGTYLLGAVNTQDIPVIQASALLFVVAYAIINLAVDITYGYLNPRIRTA
jgi:peptide/nickel transport system permease protein